MYTNSHEVVTVKRTCEAIEIPSGNHINLYEGTEVIITQSLGGNYTVMTHQGLMASVANKDADALGKEPLPVPSAAEGSALSVEEQVWNQLRTCYDPEIPHNIVDLGLVYECRITPFPVSSRTAEGRSGIQTIDSGVRRNDTYQVDIKMTLTAPGCGMGDWLKEDVKQKVLSVPGVKQADVKVVFDPPWDRSKMHKALRRELNME